MTLNNLYRYIINQLADVVGMDEATTMACMLLKHFTSYDKVFICLNPDTKIDMSIIKKIDMAIDELQNHKPIQYILGETFFCNLPFLVDESVLIPRPETEELVQWILENPPQHSTIIDICTGSGCIAVSLANYIENSQVYAIDISDKALEMAKENAILNHANINFSQKDILSSTFNNDINIQFDIIVSNPPYVRKSEKQYMHKRVLEHEPSLALFVEDDNPLLFYKKILEFGQKHLIDSGRLYFEINEVFGKEIINLFLEYGYDDVILRKDIHNKDRMICGTFNN